MCPIESALNAHMAQIEEDEAYEDAIEDRAWHLMDTPEYSPRTPANMSEALGEIDLTDISLDFSDADQSAVVLERIRIRVLDYWYSAARKEAERTVFL